MSRVCELTGISVQSGNNVSHSNRKTRRKFLPNLHNVSFFSKVLGSSLRFRVTSRALKTVDKFGGLDNYLLTTKDKDLSSKAIAVKVVLKDKCTQNS